MTDSKLLLDARRAITDLRAALNYTDMPDGAAHFVRSAIKRLDDYSDDRLRDEGYAAWGMVGRDPIGRFDDD